MCTPRGHSSEHASFHSRVGNAALASSLPSASVSGSSNAHARLPGHSFYPSSCSGHSIPACAHVLTLVHPGSVDGPMSPTLSAFEHPPATGSIPGRGQSDSRSCCKTAHVRTPKSRRRCTAVSHSRGHATPPDVFFLDTASSPTFLDDPPPLNVYSCIPTTQRRCISLDLFLCISTHRS
ncbi:hypothetical protein MSAN_00440400 [Mycena sanguinolenta]|uniref:Uncharacterized protein n=1 Tax=Mycena sanguinolenta TaxID=230812 RepID=A0A8H7DJF7_9AGAR|nr:hypothetical protein MSAN_00440400 [Mycena sanguinolenta]